MYIDFKSLRIIKEHWWTLTLSWPDKVQRMFSTAHKFLNKKLNHRWFYNLYYIWALRVKLYLYIIFTSSMGKYSSSTQLYSFSIYCCLVYVSSLSLISSHSFFFYPLLGLCQSSFKFVLDKELISKFSRFR